jgi:hypothetical protein
MRTTTTTTTTDLTWSCDRRRQSSPPHALGRGTHLFLTDPTRRSEKQPGRSVITFAYTCLQWSVTYYISSQNIRSWWFKNSCSVTVDHTSPYITIGKGSGWKGRRLTLIIYHHNLDMWYRVVYISDIDGIWVSLEVLSRRHKRNVWFLHFKFFPFSSGDMADIFRISNWKFHFKFKNENFRNENFQILSFQNFVAYFNFLNFPLVVWPNFFQISKSFFPIFPFPSGVMAKFFQNWKTNPIQILKTNFFHFKFSLWHFFSAQGYQIY